MEPKPHVVCVPCPVQGHINPMFKLAKLLHSKGLHITFVHTEYNKARLLRARGPGALDGLPSFRFEAMPDGLPGLAADADATQDVSELSRSVDEGFAGPFRALLARLDGPAVTCVVLDAAMYPALGVAEELGVQRVVFFPAGAGCLVGVAQYPKLIEMGIVPFKDSNFMTNGELDKVLDWAHWARGIRLKDIPTFIRTTNSDDFMLNHTLHIVENIKNKASAILLNTFDVLENEALQSLSTDFPPLYAVGPLQLLLDPLADEGAKSMGSNLWREDSRCLDWLATQAPNSVVYVNFGSITVMTKDQLVEFAWGLANSKLPFLWITRSDLVVGGSAVLPPELLLETRGRGLVAGWCDQERVLAHPAIGTFLTHNGWNSTLEGICNGVPMVCWPFFADQQTNCWYCCSKWGVGVEIDANVERNEVERQVKEVMEGEKGKEMKRRAMEWKGLAREATRATSGSSYYNVERAIRVILSQGQDK